MPESSDCDDVSGTDCLEEGSVSDISHEEAFVTEALADRASLLFDPEVSTEPQEETIIAAAAARNTENICFSYAFTSLLNI